MIKVPMKKGEIDIPQEFYLECCELYWQDQVDNGNMSMEEVRARFADTPEGRAFDSGNEWTESDQYGSDGQRADNPWQKAALEQKSIQTHDSLTDSYRNELGRMADQGGMDFYKHKMNNEGMSAGEANRQISGSPEGQGYVPTPDGPASAADLINAANYGIGQRGSDDFNLAGFGSGGGAGGGGSESTPNEDGYNFSDGGRNPIMPNNSDAGRITYPEGGPVGGVINPTQTYSPHTGFRKDGEDRIGTGGGYANAMPAQSPREQMAARPDLQRSAPIVQAAVNAPAKPVQSIQSQMAQAQALRAGGSQNG
jgi:hypothetical protein